MNVAGWGRPDEIGGFSSEEQKGSQASLPLGAYRTARFRFQARAWG